MCTDDDDIYAGEENENQWETKEATRSCPQHG